MLYLICYCDLFVTFSTLNCFRRNNNYENQFYNTWFYDLHGGRTEYVITIACMIGNYHDFSFQGCKSFFIQTHKL